jgi:hypothetical protein
MPFVLAPNLWRRLALTSRREIERTVRAHGDNLLVDADSPESLDEVYWRIFCGDEYLKRNQLVPHAPGAEAVARYVRYVNAILAASEPRLERYLSKNNNNILRLGALQQAFPNALILIPFRDPLQHAQSLLRQHVRFSEMQAQREFTLSYMTWLGHHEFGLDHRPFHFAGAAPSTYAPGTLSYWLQLWCETYSWLEHSKPKAALFVCYEDLCNRPETWKRLAELADVSPTDEVGDPLKLSERPVTADFDSGLAERATTIYSRLVERSHPIFTALPRPAAPEQALSPALTHRA